MADIRFEEVSKVFDDGTVAVDRLDLDVQDGEFLILVGPSGSGKSTALRMLAGLEEISAGEVRIGERVVNDVAPKDRDLAMVFQSYALYPHMTVAQNLGFALKMSRVPKGETADRVATVARKLGIGELLERRPRQLSGGQRQRVALGRAIVRAPQAFLMDEPLSNLDAKLRVEMRTYISRLHGEIGSTMVYVTHDQVEAMTMGDRVAVMRDGRLEQCDAPQALYDRPANVFVASFMGSPAMNLLRGRAWGTELALGSHRVPLPESVADRMALADGAPVIVGVRPEALCVAGPDEPGLELPVVLTEALGSDLLVHLEIDAPAVLTPEQQEAAAEVGAPPPAITARLAPEVDAVAGGRLRVAFDARRLHLFDAETEQALL